MIRKKKSKLRRRLVVTKRKVKRFTLKKAGRWFKDNLRQHPFILGFLFLLWFGQFMQESFFTKSDASGLLKLHSLLFVYWLVLVTLSNFLKDKERVKWYFRKRFVFFTLCLIKPFGLILLWSGARFKRVTKIIFTIVFVLWFVRDMVSYKKRYDKLIKMSSFDTIVEMISKPKKRTFLKTVSQDVLAELKFSKTPKRPRLKLAISDIAERCSPALVEIKTRNKKGQDMGGGSGFIISENGIIITNFHVIESAYQAEVKAGGAISKDAHLVKGIPDLDIAILKIDSSGLPVLTIGDSDSLVNGQPIVVLGNPLGLEGTVSSGLVSAVRSKGKIKLIQMTAPVSPGSSGGPVLNEYGEVIGITTLAYFFMVQNVNFAVPINYLDKIIKEKK